jgi:hypothetical protein
LKKGIAQMPFVKKVKLAESIPAGTVSLNPPKPTVRTRQQEFAKARAREEQFLDQLERAQQEFATVSAESVANENLGIETVTDAIEKAQHKVDGAEKALMVAKQRTAHAEEALRIADWESRRQSCLRLVEKLTDVLRHWQTKQVEAAEYLQADAVPLIDEIRGFGFDVINHKIINFSIGFKPKLLGLYDFMPNCKTTEALFLRDEPVSAMAPQVEDVERLTRP